jgi:hypothetical protein
MSILRGFVLSIVIDPENLFQPDERVRLMLQGLLKGKCNDQRTKTDRTKNGG